MIKLPGSIRIGERTDLRFHSEDIVIGENVVFDDDVRVVVPNTGSLTIRDNVKIGKGSIINCGGRVEIGNNVSLYGYCYIQSSRWQWREGQKEYNYFDIKLEDFVVIAPFSVISGNMTIPFEYRGHPGQVIGEW